VAVLDLSLHHEFAVAAPAQFFLFQFFALKLRDFNLQLQAAACQLPFLSREPCAARARSDVNSTLQKKQPEQTGPRDYGKLSHERRLKLIEK